MLFDCSELVLKHFDKPQQLGKLDRSKPTVVYCRIGSEKIGEILDLYLNIDSKQKIKDVKFKALGNPYLIAGASFLCKKVLGLKVNEAEQISYQDIMNYLQFPTAKQATAVMLESALKQAIDLWRKKHVK